MDIRKELERIIDTRKLTDDEVLRLWHQLHGRKAVA